MTTTKRHGTKWSLGLESPDPGAAVRWFAENVWQGRAPEQLVVKSKQQRPKADWLTRMKADKYDAAAAYFTADRKESLVVHTNGLVAGRFPFEPDIDRALTMLESAPFDVASFGTLREPWPESYRAPSFGQNHFPHGWGCAFKGAGRDRLVSRRWLDFGPWVLGHGKGDLSLVQFHALDAPVKKALAQAKPGHHTMGISEEGGFLQKRYVFHTSLSGLYDQASETLRIVCLGRKVEPVEMLDARAAVKQGALTATQPLKRIAYVFTKPDEARAHLHELWLRELECWTVIDGVEQRLDTSYAPQPVPPAWAE